MKEQDLVFFENLVGKDTINGGFGRDYNIFSMDEGIKIAEALQTKDEIIRFSKLDWNGQKELVPSIDDGHSGNTFTMAIRFAIAYLPQLIVNKRDEKIDSIIQ